MEGDGDLSRALSLALSACEVTSDPGPCALSLSDPGRAPLCASAIPLWSCPSLGLWFCSPLPTDSVFLACGIAAIDAVYSAVGVAASCDFLACASDSASVSTSGSVAVVMVMDGLAGVECQSSSSVELPLLMARCSSGNDIVRR